MARTTNKLRAVLRSVALVGSCALVLSACGSSGGSSSSKGTNSGTGKKLVYFMAPNTTPTRYIQQDGPDFQKSIQALDPNIEVKFVNGGGSSATQLSQANAAIAAGAKALVIVAADPNTSASILQAADRPPRCPSSATRTRRSTGRCTPR